MSAHCARLSRLFTVEYAKRINAQIIHPAQTVIVKPNELESALCRPLHMSVYEPHQSPAYLAATLSYGIIRGHPFMDGNKRTGSSPRFELIVSGLHVLSGSVLGESIPSCYGYTGVGGRWRDGVGGGHCSAAYGRSSRKARARWPCGSIALSTAYLSVIWTPCKKHTFNVPSSKCCLDTKARGELMRNVDRKGECVVSLVRK